MHNKKAKMMAGAVIGFLGVVLLISAFVIKHKVEGGRELIHHAEKKVSTGEGLFNASPYSKQIGKSATESAHKKIAMGKKKIAYYEKMALAFQVAGIVLIVIGGGIIVYVRRSA